MMPELVFRGTPHQIGEEHGECLRREIQQTFEVYKELWKLSDEQICGEVKKYAVMVFKYLPHLDEEIEGIACGARVPVEQIYAINARTELLKDAAMIECTSLGITAECSQWGNVVLAQNWDWLNSVKGLARIVELVPAGKPRIKTLIEPGMVAKIGLNDAGVGVCLNYLDTPVDLLREGVPVHVVVRAVLESASVQDSFRKVLKFRRSACAHYLIGSADNTVISLEATPDEISQLACKEIVTHTNSYSHHHEVCPRQQLFEKALHDRGYPVKKVSFGDITSALDAQGVCFPQKETKGSVDTLATIIMNLNQKQMLVRDSGEKEFVMHYFI
ncbi:hypothetical protein HY485_02575 [Candidatus Woesearchaeota archaeon]|nr:hypothetical protein [Candidatus Woesearchaeota archaeon]